MKWQTNKRDQLGDRVWIEHVLTDDEGRRLGTIRESYRVNATGHDRKRYEARYEASTSRSWPFDLKLFMSRSAAKKWVVAEAVIAKMEGGKNA